MLIVDVDVDVAAGSAPPRRLAGTPLLD